MILKILSWTIVALTIFNAYRDFKENKGYLKEIYFKRPMDYLWAFLICVCVLFSLGFLLTINLPKFLTFSFLSVFTSGSEQAGTNLIMTPFNTNEILIIIPFWIIISLCLPYLAKVEEEVFRKGYHTKKERLKKSIYFGFAHMIMGVPIIVALVLCVVGWIYSWFYMREYNKTGSESDAVFSSTSIHAKYNFIAISIFVLIMLMLK